MPRFMMLMIPNFEEEEYEKDARTPRPSRR